MIFVVLLNLSLPHDNHEEASVRSERQQGMQSVYRLSIRDLLDDLHAHMISLHHVSVKVEHLKT